MWQTVCCITENDAVIKSELDKQNEIYRKQDEQLEQLHQNVKTVHEVGIAIGDEIEQQDAMLNDMSDHVEKTDSKITQARRKIDQVIEKSSNWKIGIVIGALVIFLVIVIVLIFVL